MRKGRRAAVLLALVPVLGAAQDDVVVITATRQPQPSLEIPASIDRIYGEEIREGRPQGNLSESLGRVPGIVVQNRQNYADRKSTRLNSSHGYISYAVFCLKKKTEPHKPH